MLEHLKFCMKYPAVFLANVEDHHKDTFKVLNSLRGKDHGNRPLGHIFYWPISLSQSRNFLSCSGAGFRELNNFPSRQVGNANWDSELNALNRAKKTEPGMVAINSSQEKVLQENKSQLFNRFKVSLMCSPYGFLGPSPPAGIKKARIQTHLQTINQG